MKAPTRLPFFSVIIPAFNREAFIRATLDSVLAQEFGDFEVIVVDDGSTDGTADVAADIREARVLAQSNAGPGAARNIGLAQARGKYVAFLDSDDLWFPWTLAYYANVIQQTESPAFVAGKPFHFEHEASLRAATATSPVFERFRDYLASGDQWRWWGVTSFVIRAEVLHFCGGFTEQNINGEDADLALKLGEAPGFVQITNPPTFAYRVHANSAMKNLSKTLAGTWLGIHTEQAEKYPGGSIRARERWRILTRHARPVTLDCLRHGLPDEAWKLYRAMARWHFALGRWRYLAGFPMKALISRIK